MNAWHSRLVMLATVLALTTAASAAPTVSSTFDVDADGWTATPGEATVAHNASGGNPDGFLRSTDTGPATPEVIAPVKFRGDLRAYDGGFLAYDMKVLNPTTPVTSVGDGLGRLQIAGGGSNATFSYLPTPPLPSPDQWRRFVVPLTAAAFDTTQANWEQVLANVTSLSVIIQHGTEVGLDNVQLVPAPDLSNLIVFLEPGFSFEIVNRDIHPGQGTAFGGSQTAIKQDGVWYLNGDYYPGGGAAYPAIIKMVPGGASDIFAYLSPPAGFQANGPWAMHFDADGALVGTILLTEQETGRFISQPLVRIFESGAPAPIAFQEHLGLIVMEAEHFDGNIAAAGHNWTTASSKAGFAGTGYVEVLPNNGASIDSGYVSTSPQLVFNVMFDPGTYPKTFYLWVRGSANSGSDDSCHGGLDGAGPASADRISGFVTTNWVWKRDTMDGSPATLVIPGPGLRTIHLWMREDGLRIDRLLLRTNSSGTAPTGIGPAESPRE